MAAVQLPEKVLVMGASPESTRYSYMATRMLKEYGHQVTCYGKRKGECSGEPILNEFPDGRSFDTVTLYLNPTHQQEYYDRILALKPRRVIFNPGTENDEFEDILRKHQIDPDESCTLVLLRTGQF